MRQPNEIQEGEIDTVGERWMKWRNPKALGVILRWIDNELPPFLEITMRRGKAVSQTRIDALRLHQMRDNLESYIIQHLEDLFEHLKKIEANPGAKT